MIACFHFTYSETLKTSAYCYIHNSYLSSPFEWNKNEIHLIRLRKALSSFLTLSHVASVFFFVSNPDIFEYKNAFKVHNRKMTIRGITIHFQRWHNFFFSSWSIYEWAFLSPCSLRWMKSALIRWIFVAIAHFPFIPYALFKRWEWNENLNYKKKRVRWVEWVEDC